MADGANLGDREGFDSEEAADYQDGEGVEVVCEESGVCVNHRCSDCGRRGRVNVRRFDATDEGVQHHAYGQEECCCDDVDAGPDLVSWYRRDVEVIPTRQ